MKKTTLTFLLTLSACIYLMAQAPQSFNYQAIARDGAGNILADQQISVKISLLQASPEGEALYSESHKTLTNSFGLFSLKIGRGNALKGDFSSLKWHENSHYIQIELDAQGGQDYQMMGTAELLSVPYALYAERSGDGSRSNDYDWGSYFNDLFTGTGGAYPSGNVGIGLTNPQAKLQVEGDILAEEIRSVSTDQTSTDRVVNNKIITTYAPETQASVNASSFQIKAATEDATHSIGNTNQINGMKFSFIHRNNGSLNDFYGIRSQGGMPNGSWGGAGSSGSINNLTGLRSELYGEKGSVSYAQNISLQKIGDNFSNYSYLQIGNSGDINGNYGIYNSAAYANYFAGNTGLGTSNPQAMLHVSGKTLLQPSASSSSKIEIDNNSNNAEVVMYDENGTAGTKLSAQGTSYINSGSLVVGNTAADPSAALEVSSLNKGFLPPRMTKEQRDNIAAPAEGLLIYQSNDTIAYYYWDGSEWSVVGSEALGIDELYDGRITGNSIYLGEGSGDVDEGLHNNVALGMNALNANNSGQRNTAVGNYSLSNNTSGAYNAAFGCHSLRTNDNGSGNTAIGEEALSHNYSGNDNTALGKKAMTFNDNGSYNVVLGAEADVLNMGGDNNTIIGWQAGRNEYMHSKSGNVFIGYKAGYNDTTDNKLYIENSDSSTPLIYGDFSLDSAAINGDLGVSGELVVSADVAVATESGRLGVGTTVPTEKLEVNGNILADTLKTGTVYAFAYSSNSSLKMQTNNTTRIYVDGSDGRVGVGTTTPESSALIDMNSTSKGFLPPRMTTSERDNISNPVPGLMIYNTETWCINYYSGLSWMEMSRDTSCGAPITDPRDGQIYNTVQIGDQCWMAENINAILYPNGDSIPFITNNSDWINLGENDTADACCYYNNDPNREYGLLYTYAAATGDHWVRDNDDAQGICPDGWHLPGDDEWKILEGTVDTEYPVGDTEWDELGSRGYDAGRHLKSITGWRNYGNGDNSSGFAALPGGYRSNYNGGFFSGNMLGLWWTATESSSFTARDRELHYTKNLVSRSGSSKLRGLAVRCLRN